MAFSILKSEGQVLIVWFALCNLIAILKAGIFICIEWFQFGPLIIKNQFLIYSDLSCNYIFLQIHFIYIYIYFAKDSGLDCLTLYKLACV